MLLPRATLFDLISARSTWLGQRQAVLGQNVAQADTPGYLPRDLDPMGFDGLLRRSAAARLEPMRTAANHMVPAPVAAGPYRDRVDEDVAVKPSGNGVDLPDQMRKMSMTELDHQLTTSLYRRYVGMLRTAIGVPQA